MKVKKDLSRFFPVGEEWGKEVAWTAIALALSSLWSLGALIRLQNGWRTIRMFPENKVMMPGFQTIIGSALYGFWLTAAGLIVLAVWNYISQRRGSRADYTLRRLPGRLERHIRALAFPAAGLAVTVLLAAGLRWLYFWLYVTKTPADRLTDVVFIAVSREG